MFVKVNRTVINTDLITFVSVYKDKIEQPSEAISNFVNVYFGDNHKVKLEFENKERLQEFLDLIQVQEF